MKKVIYIIFALLLILIGLYSCRKYLLKRTTAKVYVTEKGSNKVVENASVALMEVDPGEFLGVPSYTLIENCMTDNNGYCEFEFKHDNSASYEVQAKHDSYYVNREKRSYKVEKGKNNEIDIPLQPEAWLKVYVKNVNQEYNRLTLGSIGIPSGGGGTFYGMSVDTFTIARRFGNYTKKLSYSVYQSGQSYEDWNHEEIDIYCSAHDTTEYTIEY